MAVDLQICVACAIGCVEQVSLGREANQDVGLLWRATLTIVVLVCKKLVKFGYPAAGPLQLGPKGLEGGAVFSPEDGELLKRFRRKSCAWIGSRPLQQAIERIADFFGTINRGSNCSSGSMWSTTSFISVPLHFGPLCPTACR
jgi:hypothetical protein